MHTTTIRAFALPALLLPLIWSPAWCQDWIRGRATFYGSPKEFSDQYDPTRGEGSFGIIAYGACGYTDKPEGTVPFPIDAVGASADQNPDYPGSCGRCYEMRCVNGIVEAKPGTPVKIINGYFDGDKLRPVLADINPNVKDTRGRAWPGNIAEAYNESFVQCWNDTSTIQITIIDSCPCTQVLKTQTKRQEWCCGGAAEPHYDLSYWAFEKLAHPVYGVQMIDFRPVDCQSGSPLPYLPGYVSPNIYRYGIGAGWSWYPYSVHSSQLDIPDYGPGGTLPATCVDLSTGGGLQFKCRECDRAGYQPFVGVSSIVFWIRSNSTTTDPKQTSSPKGEVPPLKVFLLNADTQKYCAHEPFLDTAADRLSQNGDWYLLQLPIDAFYCGNENGGAPLADLQQLEFQNTGEYDAEFCLADIQLIHK